MPEGHVIHRQARLQSKRFVGESVRVWSPQGRFSVGASTLDGRSISNVEARGKHLFYWWDSGALLHVHLGLFGRFRIHKHPAPNPTDGTRLAMSSNTDTLYLSGPTVCDVIDHDQRDHILSRLGPDPLAYTSDEEAVAHMSTLLARRTTPIAAALLDQRVVSGIGNVYRSELLFLNQINPHVRSRDLSDSQIADLWTETVSQLTSGERSGRIVTTKPEDVGFRTRSEIERGERTYVYKRAGKPCRVCGTEIRRTEFSNRKVWWCPSCQPE